MNNNTDIHICYRCSDGHSKYAPVAIYSVLANNTRRKVCLYILTDGINNKNWINIKKITDSFNNSEIKLIIPDREDVDYIRDKSVNYHGWDLVHITIFHQKYFRNLRKIFNFGIDSYCVGDLSEIWDQDYSDYHLIGGGTGHQSRKISFMSTAMIGMDIALINIEKLIHDGITPVTMSNYSCKKIGYVHDEIAYNDLSKRRFLESNLYYIYTGSYLPKKTMHAKTKLVDFYSSVKPWEVAVKGYEIFDKYIEYYVAASKIIEIDYNLPKNNIEACNNLRGMGRPFIEWFPIGHEIIGKPISRAYSLLRILAGRLSSIFN
jgi:lipopolysaccharide biosynthesis glycosyltransferase